MKLNPEFEMSEFTRHFGKDEFSTCSCPYCQILPQSQTHESALALISLLEAFVCLMKFALSITFVIHNNILEGIGDAQMTALHRVKKYITKLIDRSTSQLDFFKKEIMSDKKFGEKEYIQLRHSVLMSKVMLANSPIVAFLPSMTNPAQQLMIQMFDMELYSNVSPNDVIDFLDSENP